MAKLLNPIGHDFHFFSIFQKKPPDLTIEWRWILGFLDLPLFQRRLNS